MAEIITPEIGASAAPGRMDVAKFWLDAAFFGSRFENLVARVLWATLFVPLALLLSFGFWFDEHHALFAGRGGITAVLQDPYMSTFLVALLLSSIFFVIWQQTMRRTFATAVESGILSDDQEKIKVFLAYSAKFASMIRSPLRFIPITVLITLTLWKTFVVDWDWPGMLIAFRMVMLLFFALAAYTIGSVAWCLLSAARWIALISRAAILKIQPGHSDGCCGLEAIGNCCLQSVLTLLVGMVLCVVWANSRRLHFFSDHYDDRFFSIVVPFANATMVVLFLLATALVFLPVRSLHAQLDAFRRNQDRAFSSALEVELSNIPSILGSGDADVIKTLADRLKIVWAMDPVVLKLSTWPFDRNSLIKYAITPLATLTASVGKEILKVVGILH